MDNSPKEEKKCNLTHGSDLSTATFTKSDEKISRNNSIDTTQATEKSPVHSLSLDNLTLPPQKDQSPTSSSLQTQQPEITTRSFLDRFVDWLAEMLTKLDHYIFKQLLRPKQKKELEEASEDDVT